jgi:hypothetical protein
VPAPLTAHNTIPSQLASEAVLPSHEPEQERRFDIGRKPKVTQPDSPSPWPSNTAVSIHVRAVLTWLAIFPLVAIGLTALAPFTVGWAPVLRAFVLTLIVVPAAVYFVVPRLMSIYDRYLAPGRKGRSRLSPPRACQEQETRRISHRCP